jgi:hypothetical protein
MDITTTFDNSWRKNQDRLTDTFLCLNFNLLHVQFQPSLNANQTAVKTLKTLAPFFVGNN